MADPLKSVLEIHRFFSDNNIPYVVIGGIAVQYWGEPRLTQDIDVTVLMPVNDTEKFIKLVVKQFKSRVTDPIGFAKRNRMIIVQTADNTNVDISLGIPGYEEEVMRRAIDYELESGKKIRLCSAEDLIIHKAVAGRPIDFQDIEGIISKQNKKLDYKYILHWLKQFAEALDRPVDKKFEDLWREILKED